LEPFFTNKEKGRMTIDRLKSMHPNLEVLLSSGYAVDGQASDIPKRGCNGFIQKRFNFERLSRKQEKPCFQAQ
jgi:DNA-binding NtrC family response regulator